MVVYKIVEKISNLMQIPFKQKGLKESFAAAH